MRKNGSLFWITLAILLPLPGCGVTGLDYLGGGNGFGRDPYKDGFVQILPTTVTLRVNEKRTVVANLDGPIAYFVRYRWTVSPSSIELVPRPCSGIANNHRECGAEIMAMASGVATVTFTAGLDVEYDFFDVKVSLRVNVLP
jgi:hypothetical protein